MFWGVEGTWQEGWWVGIWEAGGRAFLPGVKGKVSPYPRALIFNECAMAGVPHWCTTFVPWMVLRCVVGFGGRSFISRTIGGCEPPTSNMVCPINSQKTDGVPCQS